MSEVKTIIGLIMCALPIPEGSKAGHDQLLLYVEDADQQIHKVWETLAPTKCEKGRNKGEPYREVRLKELGIPNFQEAEDVLIDARAIISYAPQKQGDEILTDDKGNTLYSWNLDRILHKKQA